MSRPGGASRVGPGDVEFGAKYNIFDPGMMAGIYPAITVPTGDDQRGLGAGSVRAFLPVWLGFQEMVDYGGAKKVMRSIPAWTT